MKEKLILVAEGALMASLAGGIPPLAEHFHLAGTPFGIFMFGALTGLGIWLKSSPLDKK